MDARAISVFLRRICLFGLFAACVYIAYLAIFGTALPKTLSNNLQYRRGSVGYSLSRLAEAKQTSNVDILFLGSSHSYRGFDPRIFAGNGLKTFNLGSNVQTPLQTNLLIDRYLDELNPKMIIYEVYGFTFTSDGTESSVDIMSNDENDISSVRLAMKQRNLKVINTLLYSEIMCLLKLEQNIENNEVPADHYVEGGFVSRDGNYRDRSQPTYRWQLREDQFRAFEQVLSKIRKKGIKVLLVQAPITKSMYNAILNRDEFDTRMEKYGTYLNFNHIVDLDDSVDFYDSHHLNSAGVQKFDEAILQYLRGKVSVIHEP